MEKWVIAAKRADFQKIAQTFHIDPVTARLIRNRDVVGMEEMEKYLHGDLSLLPSPWRMKDMEKAVDILENQVVRYKKRMRTKVRQGGENFVAEYQAIMVPEEDLDEEPLYKIERIKHFEVKPMDAEEAVMEMELIGHNFFVFRNGETDEVNVVYKRKNGSYGLIEPEY